MLQLQSNEIFDSFMDLELWCIVGDVLDLLLSFVEHESQLDMQIHCGLVFLFVETE